MNRRRLFISKAMRPDITKPVSDRIYYDDCLSAPGNADEQSMYPACRLRGAPKTAAMGKKVPTAWSPSFRQMLLSSSKICHRPGS